MRRSKAEPVTAEREPVAPLPIEPSSGLHARGGELPPALGRHRLLFRIGAGGMGEVYAAELSSAHGFQRLVAVKVLHAALDESSREAFVREAQLAAALDHRNVVSAIDFGETDEHLYIVMDLVSGVALSQLLSRLVIVNEPLDMLLGAWIVAEMAEGLDAAHELRSPEGEPLHLVHRDVSPQNVLLGYDGRVCITDFGVAKLADGSPTTGEGIVKGKLSYMAPEQFSGGAVDRRTDVFALGIVLYEILSGHRLFVGETPAAIALAVLGSRIPPLGPDVPEAFAAIALRCLQKEPEARYATAREVADALSAAIRSNGQMPDEKTLAMLLARSFEEERRAFEAKLKTSREESSVAKRPVSLAPPGRKGAFAAGLLTVLVILVAFVAMRFVHAPTPAVVAPQVPSASSTAEPIAAPSESAAPRVEASSAASTPSERPLEQTGTRPPASKRPPKSPPRPPEKGGVFRSL
jgi:serine/threonine-protein kinase